MDSPYEQGYRDGQWTREKVAASGLGTPDACLAIVEQMYQGELLRLADISTVNPAVASRHALYLDGSIRAARETLRALINQQGGH